MPNLITHTLFCEDVLDSLHNELLDSHRMLFITGGEGPDFLFFHHSDPFVDAFVPSKLRKYGGIFHDEHVNAFYLSALSSIEQQKNSEIREDMIACLAGHLCHWALDSTMHPLIYARTGNCKGASSWNHHRYESLLDAALLMYRKHVTIKDYEPWKECFSSDRRTARAISQIYGPAIETIYGESIRPADFAQCLKDWERLQRRFYDPSGLKKTLLRPVENVLHLDNLMTGFSIPNNAEDNVDICNLLHTTWRHPVTGIESTESVFDLLDKALEKAKTAITLFFDALNHPASTLHAQKWIDFLGDRNYDMDLPGSPEPVFFDLIDLSD